MHQAGRARFTVPTADFDRNSCRIDAAVFTQLSKLTGEFTLDAYAPSAINALASKWCTSADNFVNTDCSGHHVWIDAPVGQQQQYLQHYLQCKKERPGTTSAVLLVPKDKQLRPLLQGMTFL